MRDVFWQYTGPDGAVITSKGPRVITRNGRRRASLDAKLPSAIIATGHVEGGSPFNITFDADASGAVTVRPPAAAAPSGAGTALVSGAACGPAPAAAAVASPPPPPPPRAEAVAPLNPTHDGVAWTAAQVSAYASSSAAPKASSSGPGPNLDLYQVVNTAPAALSATGGRLLANVDRVTAARNEPVNIYMLANDRIPDVFSSQIYLFSSIDSRGEDAIELTSLFDGGNGQDGEDVYTSQPSSTNANSYEQFGWTLADSLDTAAARGPQVEALRFMRDSYISYRPTNAAGPRTVTFTYTVRARARAPLADMFNG